MKRINIEVIVTETVMSFPDIVDLNGHGFSKYILEVMVDSLLRSNNKVQAVGLVCACRDHYTGDYITDSLREAVEYINQYVETGIFY